MHEYYRDAKLKELRDQLTRFAPKGKKIEQAGLAEKLYGEIEPDRPYAFDYLCFRITNTHPENGISPGSGMGIENVRNRLKLTYPRRSELKVQDENNLFMVEMKIKQS